MSERQKPKTIPVHYCKGPPGKATVLGNNAAWMCLCGSSLPVLFSGHLSRDKPVHCGCCERCFVVKTKGDKCHEGEGRTIPIEVLQY